MPAGKSLCSTSRLSASRSSAARSSTRSAVLLPRLESLNAPGHRSINSSHNAENRRWSDLAASQLSVSETAKPAVRNSTPAKANNLEMAKGVASAR